MAAGAALGFGIGEIQGVTMDIQDDVSGRIADGRIRIGRGVVEEPNDVVVGLLGGLRLLRGNEDECNENGGINGNSIIQ